MSALVALGIIAMIIGIIMIVGYFGYLLKHYTKEKKLSKITIILSEWVGFSPFTIGLLLMGVGLLLVLKGTG